MRIFIISLLLLLLSSTLCLFAGNGDIATLLDEVKRAEASNDDLNKADVYNRLGYAYWGERQFQDAIIYFEKSVSINSQVGNTNALINLYSNLGMLYGSMNDYETALVNHQKSQDIRIASKENNLICQGYINLARTSQALKRYNASNGFAESALDFAKEMEDNKLIKACYGILYENANSLGINSKALEYFEYYSAFDNVLKQERLDKITKETQQVVAEKEQEVQEEKEEKEKLLHEKELTEDQLHKTEQELEVTEAERQLNLKNLERAKKELKMQTQINMQQRKIQLLYVAGLFALGLLLMLVYRNFRNKKKANLLLEAQNNEISRQRDIIEKKNQSITESITYAQHIQESMLLSEDKLKEHLPESFILFKPKEIVSGDFYWFNLENFSSFLKPMFQNETDKDCDRFIIAALDCTGHGVPGGFMSMIGYNLLDEIVSNGINKPNYILDSLHFGIKHALKQWDTDNTDGMDAALCKIDFAENKVQFAGANNPLVIIEKGEVKELKGVRFPIGGQEFRSRTPYELQEYVYDEPVTCYIFSDGFADQFGGPKNKKFGTNQFYELLADIYNKPMDEQKTMLNDCFVNWKGEGKQIDDLLVMGFKLKPGMRKEKM